MKMEITQVLVEVDKYQRSSDSAKKIHKDLINRGCDRIQELAENNLNDPMKISLEFFDNDTISTFKTILFMCRNKPIFHDEESTVNVGYCTHLESIVIQKSDDLNNKLKEIKEISTKKTPELTSDISTFPISVSADRTVYPLDSVIHARANLPSILEGKKIVFEVLNSKRGVLRSQIIDPITYDDYPELKDANIFQVSFKMEGDEWKVGETYIVRATYGSSYVEDSFFIDQRMPVVQSDKSVYTIGSDMILTVIDPDADKDNQVAEYVGDREDSKLIIKSKHGEIKGYRLRETGDSTGIFQGIIGILGIREDGSILKRNVNGKIIDKIQGTGVDDGFIAGKRGEEITISYKNKTGTAHLTAFMSNWGATIKMDKKTYKPNDIVRLKIVSPDLNFDSQSIDEIGHDSESNVTIRTGKGELSSYRLIETGPNTAIFTGEFQLTESEETLHKSKNGVGPKDGMLLCNKEDYVEVIFNMFDYQKFVSKAMIKS